MTKASPVTTSASPVTTVEPTVALLDWSQLIEDYLDNIGVSFDSFCREMSGGWMFGYIDALASAGVRTVLYCFSARVKTPTRRTHRATGATVCVLPAHALYRAARRRIVNPYAQSLDEATGHASARGARRLWLAALKESTAYLSTPPVRLARELRRDGCDALLCQEYEHGRFDVCLLLGRLLGLPVFAAFQGGDASLNRLERLVRRRSVRAADGLIVASQSEAERVRRAYGLPERSIARIFNPIDTRMWPEATDGGGAEARRALGIPATARVAVWHGRVDFRRKGLDVLLEAWRKVCDARAGRDLRLLLVGTGNDARELRDVLAAMSLRGTTPRGLTWIDEYVNDRARLRSYLHAADVYVFPSRHEGFPVAPLEAMACGLPLVASDAQGVPDILEDGEDSGGVMIKRGETAAFAAALGRLLDDDALSRTLGARARRRVEDKFSLEAVGGELRAFLMRPKTVAAFDSESETGDASRMRSEGGED